MEIRAAFSWSGEAIKVEEPTISSCEQLRILEMNLPNDQRVAWPVEAWGDAVGLRRTKIWDLIKKDVIASVKVGNKRLIITPPAEFVARLPKVSG